MDKNLIIGRAIPLEISNIDTDQIIPAKFCYSANKKSYSDGLFGNWREDSTFVLNDNKYKNANILVAGASFATGSSREFAVWAIKDYGINVVIADDFGEIFYKNAIINKLLPLKINFLNIQEIWKNLKDFPDIILRIDLLQNKLEFGEFKIDFELKENYRNKFLSTSDDISEVFKYEQEIIKYEKKVKNNIDF